MTEFKSFFKVVGGNEGALCHYRTRLDPYGCGCAHDCSYCYAKSLLSFRGLWHPEAPRVASIDAIKRRISRLKAGSVVRLGGMTDPLQPLEQTHGVTRATVALLNRARVHYLLVTKSHLVASPEFRKFLDPDLAHIQISVTNTNDRAALAYEWCSLSSKRLEAVSQLQKLGFDVSLRLSPFIREFIDPAVIAQAEPKKIIVEFLRVNHWIEKWLNGLVDLSPYTLVRRGGYRHLPLGTKQSHLLDLKACLPGAQISVCEDVPEHAGHWRLINPNPDDCCNLRLNHPASRQYPQDSPGSIA